jgi:hypothetical protein
MPRAFAYVGGSYNMVTTILHRWVMPNSRQLVVGLVCWVLCSVAAVAFASQSGAPWLPTIVTWNEWLVAIVLIPVLFSIGATGPRAAMRWARWIAATVFGLDLLVRALFRLGWQPFL